MSAWWTRQTLEMPTGDVAQGRWRETQERTYLAPHEMCCHLTTLLIELTLLQLV